MRITWNMWFWISEFWIKCDFFVQMCKVRLIFWKNVLLLSTYRCKNVEKVDRLFLAALEKNAMRTKKGMKFYHSFDKCDDDDPAAAAQVFIFFFHDLE